MTSLVGIRCSDGVVIGADSAATLGDGGYLQTIEQPVQSKIDIIGERIIVAGTGYVGHGQRFCHVVRKLWDAKELANLDAVSTGKKLAHFAVNDFGQTMLGDHLKSLAYSALVACPADGQAMLCEFLGRIGFQPEVKYPNDLWFTSMGSGQPLTDPLLALLRKVYWPNHPPDLQGGIFMTVWALQHACELNPGGIKEPISIAILARKKGQLKARMLENDETLEHQGMVKDAERHMAKFREELEGKSGAASHEKPPELPKSSASG